MLTLAATFYVKLWIKCGQQTILRKIFYVLRLTNAKEFVYASVDKLN